MFKEIARIIDKRFDIYIEPPFYCGTHYVGEIMRIVKLRWHDFTEGDRDMIRNILSIDETEDPPLVNLL